MQDSPVTGQDQPSIIPPFLLLSLPFRVQARKLLLPRSRGGVVTVVVAAAAAGSGGCI